MRSHAQRRQGEAKRFKARCEALFAKEARCPACRKAAEEAGDGLEPRICTAHMRVRREMAGDPRRDAARRNPYAPDRMHS